MNEIISITKVEYDKLSSFVYNQFGINLGDKKQALVTGRLNKLLKQSGFNSFSEYYSYLNTDTTGKALDDLINRISTNHTYFNRENSHFEFLKNVAFGEINLNGLADKSIRFWSAGCSYGEEPYTLAMLLLEHFGHYSDKVKLKVLATDISQNALIRAARGVFSADNTSKLPVMLKNKYFIKKNKEEYEVIPKVKEIVTVKRLNFMRETFPFKKKFHCIFCRNVMIYFDPPTRDRLITRFAQFMEINAYFFIGLSESIGRTNKYFRFIQPGVYQKIG